MPGYWSDSDSCPPLSVHSSPRTSTSSSTNPSSLLSLKSDIDRSLMTFHTEIDASCFEDLEDQLITCPNETFADLCYSDAIDTNPANDPDWCIFVKTPRRINRDYTDNSVSDEFGFLRRPLSIDPYAKPDSPAIESFVSGSCTTESNEFGYAFPFQYGDSPSAMTIPDPYDSIHYSPTPIIQVKQPTRWDRTITRLTTFARQRL